MSYIAEFQRSLVVPEGWTKGERIEIEKMDSVFVIHRPWSPAINTVEVTNDVFLHYRTQWEVFNFISWWFG